MLNYILGKSTDIESAIKRGKRLKRLELQFPKYDINDYSHYFAEFVNLKKLFIQVDIRYPYDFPQKIGELNNLENLQILNYPFTKFPNWVFKLTKLNFLMLRGNDIEKIPERIVELNHLKHLRIENTSLTSIPECLSSLTELKSLSLVDNFKLVNINKTHLPCNLKWLSLEPSGIPEKQVNEIFKDKPELKMYKNYKR